MNYYLLALTHSGKTVNITGCEKLSLTRATQLKNHLLKRGLYQKIYIKEKSTE